MAADFRETVSNALDVVSEEALVDVLNELLSMEKLKEGMADFPCPHCRQRISKRVRILTPDYGGYTRALQALDGIGKGKPKDGNGDVEVSSEAVKAAVGKALDEEIARRLDAGVMSDDELVRLAGR